MRNKILMKENEEDIETVTKDLVCKVCEKYGLDADDYLTADHLTIVDHLGSFIVDAMQRLSLVRMICKDDDFISEEHYLEMQELKRMILEVGVLLDAANQIIAEIA
jgi:hypothetical protein